MPLSKESAFVPKLMTSITSEGFFCGNLKHLNRREICVKIERDCLTGCRGPYSKSAFELRMQSVNLAERTISSQVSWHSSHVQILENVHVKYLMSYVEKPRTMNQWSDSTEFRMSIKIQTYKWNNNTEYPSSRPALHRPSQGRFQDPFYCGLKASTASRPLQSSHARRLNFTSIREMLNQRYLDGSIGRVLTESHYCIIRLGFQGKTFITIRGNVSLWSWNLNGEGAELGKMLAHFFVWSFCKINFPT